jgi:hypothetical protein
MEDNALPAQGVNDHSLPHDHDNNHNNLFEKVHRDPERTAGVSHPPFPSPAGENKCHQRHHSKSSLWWLLSPSSPHTSEGSIVITVIIALHPLFSPFYNCFVLTVQPSRLVVALVVQQNIVNVILSSKWPSSPPPPQPPFVPPTQLAD